MLKIFYEGYDPLNETQINDLKEFLGEREISLEFFDRLQGLNPRISLEEYLTLIDEDKSIDAILSLSVKDIGQNLSPLVNIPVIVAYPDYKESGAKGMGYWQVWRKGKMRNTYF